MPTAWEEIADDHLQRLTTGLQQFRIEADNLRHAANANTVIKAGNGDFVGFIKDR